MQLREAKQILRAALETASDEKLAEMLAWAQDGHMIYRWPCQCFLGSLSAERVHFFTTKCDVRHYDHKKKVLPLADAAYNWLGIYHGGTEETHNAIRQRRIVPIIKAQMRIRELHRKDAREFTATKEESHATA